MAGVCPERVPAWRAVRLEILRVGAGDRSNRGTVPPVQEALGSIVRTWAAPRGTAAPKAPGITPLTNAAVAPSRVPAFCPRHHVVDHRPAKTPCAATECIPICRAVVPARDRRPRRGGAGVDGRAILTSQLLLGTLWLREGAFRITCELTSGYKPEPYRAASRLQLLRAGPYGTIAGTLSRRPPGPRIPA